MKTAVRVLAGLVFVVVGGAGAILATINPAALIEDHQAEISDAVKSTLGRDLKFGAVTGSVLPTLHANVADVVLSGGVADGPAQIELGSVDIKISLWRAITSMGKDLELDAVTLSGLTLRVARDSDGVWNFQDILDTLERGAPVADDAPGAPETEGPTDLAFLDGARLTKFAIENARIEIDDAVLGRPLAIADFNFETGNIALGMPIATSLRAILEDGATRSPVSASLVLSELRRDLSFDPMPDIVASLTLDDVDLAPWGGLMPKDALHPTGGRVSLNVSATMKENLDVVDALIDTKITDLVLVERAAVGAPLTLSTKTKLAMVVSSNRITVEDLEIKGTGVDAAGTIRIEGEGAAGLKNADLKISVADVGRLVSVIPSTTALLPKELTLNGPVRAHITGNTSVVDLAVNLDDAHVAWAADFEKNAGRPLHLDLKGKRGADALDIPTFSLAVGSVDLKGALSVPMSAGKPFTADIKTGDVTVASLREILPAVANAVGKGQKVDGTFSVALTAKAVGEKTDARAVVALKALDVNLDGLLVKGSGALDAAVQPAGENVAVVVKSDFSSLVLQSVDAKGARVLDKPAGMPLLIDIDVEQNPTASTFKKATIVLGKTRIGAKGEMKGTDSQNATLSLDFGQLDIAFDDVRRTVPGASALPAGGTLRGSMVVTGNPNATKTMSVNVKNLDLAFGRSHVKGDVAIQNLDAPNLKIALPDVLLMFDDLRPLDPSLTESLPPGGRFNGAVTTTFDTAVPSSLDAKVKINDALYDKTQASGTLAFKDLDRPTFQFDLTCPSLDIDRLTGSDDGKKPKEKEAETPKGEDENPHGLSKAVREEIKKVSGTGTLRVKTALYSGMELKDFVGKLQMKNGVVTFDALDFAVYGGTVSAAGTVFDLGAAHTGYKLKLKTTSLDLGRALADHTSLKTTFDGRVSKDLDLSGQGLTLDDLAATLSGSARILSDALTVKTLDVLGPIGAPLKAALDAAGFGGFQGFGGGASNAGAASASSKARTRGASALEKGTTLKSVNALFQFTKGKFVLKNPLEAKTPFGALQVAGGGALDKTLGFQTTAFLEPKTVNGAVGAQAVDDKVAVPFEIGGTWDKPIVKGIDAAALIKSVMGGAALGKLGALAGKDVEGALAAAANAQETATKAAANAEKMAREEADKMKAAAAQKADEAKKIADAQVDAAKKKADDAKKAAEKEADKAKKAAKKKADEAKKKAEKEAKKKAKEAQEKLKNSIGL